MAVIEMLVGQKLVVAALPTAGGIDADIVGKPLWSTSNAAIAVITPSADGRTCEVTAKSAGSATVGVSAQGASPLSASHTVQVSASNLATAIELTVQQPPH